MVTDGSTYFDVLALSEFMKCISTKTRLRSSVSCYSARLAGNKLSLICGTFSLFDYLLLGRVVLYGTIKKDKVFPLNLEVASQYLGVIQEWHNIFVTKLDTEVNNIIRKRQADEEKEEKKRNSSRAASATVLSS